MHAITASTVFLLNASVDYSILRWLHDQKHKVVWPTGPATYEVEENFKPKTKDITGNPGPYQIGIRDDGTVVWRKP